MRIKDIKRHLKVYSIMGGRETTINHAFASALASNDYYDERIIIKAIKMLGQNPDKDLFCVYCGKLAETWDHVVGLVKNHNFSGHGHVIGNLVPCCRKCNAEKGNKNWQDFIVKLPRFVDRSKILSKYFKKYLPIITDYNYIKKICPNEIKEFDSKKEQIFKLMKEADNIATKIRKIIYKK